MRSEQLEMPVDLAGAVMSVTPAPLLSRMVKVLMRKIAYRHPRLFKNLDRLPLAVVEIKPTDLPHSFVLHFGDGQGTCLNVDEKLEAKPSAQLSGKLSVLLDMLEGRTDGDMLFFSRALRVDGDTEVVVGLRNTLDREGLHVMEDVISLFGPFARTAGIVAGLADKVVRRIKARLARGHEALHADEGGLKAEVEKLKQRLAQMEKAAL